MRSSSDSSDQDISDSYSSISSSISSLSSASSSTSSSSSSSQASYQTQSSQSEVLPDIFAETLLLFHDVPVPGAPRPANIYWDGGSNRCLVTHDFARDCSMRKENIVFRLDVIGQQGELTTSCYYLFEPVLIDGSTRRVWAYGLDKIMQPSEPVDLSQVRNLFPHVPDEIFAYQPSKEVDILIGTNFLGLHPNGGTGQVTVGDLVALQSVFGLGCVIGGTHPLLHTASSSFCSTAANLARVNLCIISPELLPSFWEGECLGVQSPKRCRKCIRCKQCTDPALLHSRKEQEELEMIRQGVQLVNGQLHVSYHFSRDPYCLPHNRWQVVKMAEKQERRLIKSGQLEAYNKEIKKYIDRGQ